MPTMLAEVKERYAEPLEELKTAVNQAVVDTGKKARIVMRRSVEAAEELKHATEREVRKRPLRVVGSAFGAGFFLGALTFWLVRRK
jgi:ElaB/YqjD/DUF883 family membrane-anchored ribosome-binding protein